MTTKSRTSIAIGLAAAITLGSGIATGTVSASPLAGSQLAVKEAASSDVVDVRHRRHRNGAAFAALALGVIGAVIAHQEYKRYRKRHHYHHYPYAYRAYPYHAYPYGYGRYHHQQPLPQHNPPSGCGFGKCGVM
jgi:hypothetical protein